MSGTITQHRDEKLCDAYIKLEHTSRIGHFWKHAVQYQFFIFEELIPALSIECVLLIVCSDKVAHTCFVFFIFYIFLT